MQRRGKQKVIEAADHYLGLLCGYLLGMEAEEAFGYGAIDPNGYLWLGNAKGGRIGVDFGNYGMSKHGLHIDIEDNFVQMLGGCRYIAIFLDGLQQGLEDSLFGSA